MSFDMPFKPVGNTIGLTTSSSTSTSQSRAITPQNFGLGDYPRQIRVVNRGTADVWIAFFQASTVVSIPTPGTTTAGTPQGVTILVPGVVEVFTLPVGQNSNIFVSDISATASQTYYMQGGEGS